MPDSTNTQPTVNQQAQGHYATQPNAFRPSFPPESHFPAANVNHNGSGSWLANPVILLTALVILGAMVAYQQTQLNRLGQEVGLMSNHLKTSDVSDRLDAHEAKLQALETRITYLDSKIAATDEKSQVALNKLKAQEDNDFFGHAIQSIKRTFGFE